MHIIEIHYRENFNRLVHQLSGRSGGWHNSQDVIQDAYMRAWQYFDTFDKDTGDFEAWFNSILHNSLRAFHNEMRRIP